MMTDISLSSFATPVSLKGLVRIVSKSTGDKGGLWNTEQLIHSGLRKTKVRHLVDGGGQYLIFIIHYYRHQFYIGQGLHVRSKTVKHFGKWSKNSFPKEKYS